MIAVDGHRHHGLIFFGQHELEDGHLGGCILERHPIRPGFDIGLACGEFTLGSRIEVAIEDLFGIGQRSSQALSDERD